MSDPALPPPPEGAAGEQEPTRRIAGRELQTPTGAAVAGLAFSLLFVASFVLLHQQPPADATSAEISEWFNDSRQSHMQLVGLYLAPFSGIAFLWFIGVIRHRIGAREDRFFATVFLGSGLLFVAMLFIGCAAAGALSTDANLDSDTVSSGMVNYSRAFSQTLFYVYAAKMAAVFTIAVSTIAFRTEVLPRWSSYLGYALALVLLLNFSDLHAVILAFPVWVAVISVLILVYERRGRPPVAAR
jgi:hypothetical protein